MALDILYVSYRQYVQLVLYVSYGTYFMNITLLAKKGGVGKSTVSLLLYEALRRAGHSVAIRDWDAQGTSSRSLRLINGELAKPGSSYDVVIHDTPPNFDHTATRAAVNNTDVVLIATTPSLADLWEAEEAAQFVRQQNQNASMRLVINKVRKSTILGRSVHASAKRADITVDILESMLTDRECYKHAIWEGWKALDREAREEVLQLALAVMALR